MGRGSGSGGKDGTAVRRRGAAKKGAREGITMKEVATHNTPEDAWMVFGGRVYDVSSWNDHPGGRIIFTHAGLDCTDTFNAFHPTSAVDDMAEFFVGELAKEDVSLTPVERDYRALRAQIRKEKLDRASPLYYVFKCSSNLAIIAAAFYLVLAVNTTTAILGGACLTALFWQQCGWLAHDFLHHQVFDNRHIGDLFGLIIGNVSQGFSVEWWKDKHNTHHAVPNILESAEGAHDGDPDIDTMPLLAWSLEMARKITHTDSKVGRFFLKNQAILYFPILLVARMSWALQSFTFVFRTGDVWASPDTALKPLHLGFREHAGLILHYLWYIGLMTQMSIGQAVMFLLVSQMFCGLLLAIAFGVGHNGMAVYEADKKPDFLTLQITTTRNVDGNFLVGWFMGGLQYQIEHHLFPDVPRHNLHLVRRYVEPLCKKHNIPYHATSIWWGTWEVLKHLSEVTTELVNEFPGI
mmetsp:Transcript_47049/g.112801  ORF Transcript_47049/g.112801 Transcript_47049/m.112801 type:complete len:465 (-) Transcript_47049:64-1458(-)